MRPYTEYPTRPRILTLESDGGEDSLEFLDNVILFRPAKHHELPFDEIAIPRYGPSALVQGNVFDVVSHTFRGFLDDLAAGSEIADNFRHAALEGYEAKWVYYPRKNQLVQVLPESWHRTALVIRNENLLRDPKRSIDWESARKKLESAVIAFVGCSIGSRVVEAVAGDLRPLHMKVADYKAFHISNANRVHLTYEDFGVNKAQVIAEYLHSVDPFMSVSVFSEGMHEGVTEDFVAGNEELGEPPASVIVEEIDDLEMKIFIREVARRHRVAVVMATDLGSVSQLDIRRFDIDPSLPLAACGVSDEELYEKLNAFRTHRNAEKWLEFATAFIGENYKFSEEFRRWIHREDPVLFSGVPQLCSTAMAGAGIASQAIARILLGFAQPERRTFNIETGEGWPEGEVL